MSAQQARVGKVYLVGAGPGAPGLITLRGVECLHEADVVLYDYLVNPQILRHAGGAEKISLGRHGGARTWTQKEINELTVQRALAGQAVVRLKGGDPAVFARGAEEVDALVEHGVPFEIVPGITAALAAGSYAGVPLTHRHCSSAVALVTGQETSDKIAPGVDYARLAQFPGTLVVYMGVTTANDWTQQLMAGGMSPDTPALLIRRCSFPDQTTRLCTLRDVHSHCSGPNRLPPPVIAVIGEVAGMPRTANWFEQLPLLGQTVLVTRPAQQATDLATRFERCGAEVLLQPAIEVRAPADLSEVDRTLSQLEQYNWVVFSSANGVHAFFQRLVTPSRDIRALRSVKLAVIGPATRDALSQYQLQADCIPGRFQAEDLAAALGQQAAGKRVLLVRASRGREVLAEQLEASGADVRQVVFYESVDVGQADAEVADAMGAGTIHWTTVTSSAIARSLQQLFGNDLQQTRLVSISPITSATLRELGYEPAAEAVEATMDGVLNAILAGAAAGPLAQNSKHQIANPKQIQNPKIQ
jgi:uroporphyrinogen III methyltransferase/synthase